MQVLSDRFLNIDLASAEYGRARCVILPVPYEGTVSFMPGTARGPEAIIRASGAVEEFDEELRRDISRYGIHTCPFVVPAASPEEQVRRVREAAARPFADGKFVLALGGEHSITPGLVSAAAPFNGALRMFTVGPQV